MKTINEYLDNIIKNKKIIEESNLSRLVEHMKNHDCGIITAFRDRKFKIKDGKKISEFGEKYTKKENRQRNKKLKSLLLSKGYSVTKVMGGYIENFNSPDAKEVGESSFFVCDIKDKKKLKKDLIELGEIFDQDSIMFIPKVNKNEKLVSYLIGTNKVKKDAFPGYKNVKKTGERVAGKIGEFFTKIRNRPFIFNLKENIDEDQPANWLGRMACKLIYNEDEGI